jgi:hypothetical protein
VFRTRRAAAAAVAALCIVTPAALAHEGNPNFRSQVRALTPAAEGVSLRVVNFDDSIELRNRSGRTVVVRGYRGEPYVRIAGDGTVAVNRRSPTHYLNEDRFAEGVSVPRGASPKAQPDWRTVDRTGRYAWHDHRIHWMAHSLPPQVKDEGRRTKVFDWKVPLTVGGRPATISGSLIWVGKESGGFPVAALISLLAAGIAGAALVIVVRRRRRRAPVKEAW